MSAAEATLVAEFRAAELRFYALAKQCEEHFFPLVRAALAQGNVKLAREIVFRCPDNVSRCFMVDAISQHTKGSAP